MKSSYVELTDVGKARISEEEIIVDDLRADEAIIAAEYSLISAGTELSRAYALKKGFSYPVRPGYSLSGRIIAKGDGVPAEMGDLVFVNAPHASRVRWHSGDDVQGPLILKIPEGISAVEATFINILLVALQGVNLSEVRLGQRVAVFGLGNIGIFTALMYKKLGCRIIGLDPVKERCLTAEKMGIETTVADPDQQEALNRITDKEGIDIAVDATGLAPVIMTCASCLRPYGQLILLGSPRQSYETDITSFLSALHMKNLTVRGAFNKTTPVRPQAGSDDSLYRNFSVICDLLINKDIDIGKLPLQIIDPADCEKAYYELMYQKDKAAAIIYDWRSY